MSCPSEDCAWCGHSLDAHENGVLCVLCDCGNEDGAYDEEEE